MISYPALADIASTNYDSKTKHVAKWLFPSFCNPTTICLLLLRSLGLEAESTETCKSHLKPSEKTISLCLRQVDGGKGRACRGASPGDNKAGAGEWFVDKS